MDEEPKAPRTAQKAVGAGRAPEPSAGARRRGVEHPKLIVYIKNILLVQYHMKLIRQCITIL